MGKYGQLRDWDAGIKHRWIKFEKNGEYIEYCFDNEGELQRDLYIKETDSRSYLNFASAHPNYTFSETVYSQSLRLRWIINNKDRLEKRLVGLGSYFKKWIFLRPSIGNIKFAIIFDCFPQLGSYVLSCLLGRN